MSIISRFIRIGFGSIDCIRDLGLRPPSDIRRITNIAYGPDPKWNLLDICCPAKAKQKLPVIINCHGGAWVYGTKEVWQFYCMSLAQQGFAVINFNYHLAPQSHFPAPLHDVNQVVSWVLQHGDRFDLDTQNVFMVGDSAGAHLAALYTCVCTNKQFADTFDFQVPEGFVPKAVALNCGAYSFRNTPLLRRLLPDLLGKNADQNMLDQIEVIPHLTNAFPPVYLMTSTGDYLRSETFLLEKWFRKHGIIYTARIFGNKKKRPPHVFHCNIRSKEAALCNLKECIFFHTHLDNSLKPSLLMDSML